MAAENRPTYNLPISKTLNESSFRQFFASGYDEQTGETILKVVNADNKEYSASFRLEGAENVDSSGKIISLTATSGEDENSFENPRRIYPVETVYNKFGKTFDYGFPPYSYTIMRIKMNF